MLILTALLLTMILASAALAIDLGSFYSAQTKAQSAADAAALAAAQDLGGSGSATATSDGTTIALTNYPGATVSVSEPTTNEAKVTVSASSPSYFGQALGLSSARVSASATAAVTGGSVKCTTPGSGCLALFAMSTSCSGTPPINFDGGGNNISGGIWSNGSVDIGGGGSVIAGGANYSNRSGCQFIEDGGGNSVDGTYENNATNDPPGSTAVAPTSTWPIDYSKDFPACGGTGELSCTGPCDVSTTPCPAANKTPGFCTEASNATSWTLDSWYPYTLQSGNVYCGVGTGTASNPATWNGKISANQSGSTPIKATYVAGSFSPGGGSELEACGYSASGYQASGCSASVPSPVTQNYPLIYVTGTSGFSFEGGGGSLTGDVFAPNGPISWDGGGTTITGMLEGQTITWGGGGMTADGPPAGSFGSSGGGTVSLLQ